MLNLINSDGHFAEPQGYEVLDNVKDPKDIWLNFVSGEKVIGRTPEAYIVTDLASQNPPVTVDKATIENEGFDPEKFTWATTKQILSRFNA